MHRIFPQTINPFIALCHVHIYFQRMRVRVNSYYILPHEHFFTCFTLLRIPAPLLTFLRIPAPLLTFLRIPADLLTFLRIPAPLLTFLRIPAHFRDIFYLHKYAWQIRGRILTLFVMHP